MSDHTHFPRLTATNSSLQRNRVPAPIQRKRGWKSGWFASIVAAGVWTTGPARGHNLDQLDTSIAFDKPTLNMMAARAGLNQPLIQAGDSIGLILKSTPGPGTATGAGGYMTFYIPPGTQVEKAEYGRPTAAGGFTSIPMKGPSIMAIGDGSVGSATTTALNGLVLGPNAAGVTAAAVDAAGVHNGTLAGVYGDTGIFYSTDPKTVWQSFVNTGGYDRNTGTSDNILTNNRGEARVPITKWDAEQLIAFGLSSPAAPIVDPNGRGNSPWGMASAVAGPQSGYQWAFNRDYYLDNPGDPNRMKNAVVTGPWRRVQYPGSTIAKDQVGLKSTALGFAVADASSLGVPLAPATPLPATLNWTDNTSPKALRISYGGLVLGQSEFSRVQLKILAGPGQPNSPFDARGCFFMNTDTFGGDAGGEQGGKDHLWRYYDPTTQTINPCAMLQKQFAKTPLAPGETSYFELAVINTGTTAMNNVVITDAMPVGLTYVSATPAPSSTAPLTFSLGTVPSQGVVRIRVNFTASGSGTIFNTASMSSSAGTTTAMDSLDIGLRSLLDASKTVTPSNAAPGSTVTYTVTIANSGTGPNGTPLLLTDVLPSGFTYGSYISATLNGAAAPSGAVTVNAADTTKPVFSVTQGIQAGKTLTVTFTAVISGTQASGTYGNTVSMNYESKVVTSGSLAPVTVGGGKIGDTVFRDWNGNGTQDASDEGVAGITVQLWSDPNGDGDTADGTLLGTKTTNTGGQYLFTGLAPGNYVVKVPTPPAGYTQTADPQGAVDNAGKVTLVANQEFYAMDFGYRPAGAGSIGDAVFEDIGNDGTLDAGDPGIEGITVNLYEDTNGNGTVDAGDALIATTATDVNGNYLFSGLAEGLNYIARVDTADIDLPAYFNPDSYQASTPVSKSVTSLSGSNLSADFGFWRSVPATLGDKVFVDNNGNGIFDGSDTGIPSVGVKFYRDTNGNGVADSGEYVSTQQTDINGNYLFTNLGPGDYIAVLDTADGDLPGGLTPTVSRFAVNLDPGENHLTADFPLVSIFSKVVDKATANPGETLTYTIIPRWPNSDLLTNARVTDLVPTGTSFAGAGQGGTHSAGTVTWNLGTNTPGITGHAGETPQTIVLGDATAETLRDTYIKEDAADSNFGADIEIWVKPDATKRKRSLVQWDLSSIPAGSIITSVTAQFYVRTAKSQTVTLHRVTNAWDEGTSTAADGADWTKADDNPDVFWTAPGADHDASSLGSFSIATTGAKTATSTALRDLVQAWVNGTAVNNGLLLKSTGANGDGKLGSSENATAAQRPQLIITYLSTSVTLPAAAAASDTYLRQDQATNNFGAGADLFVRDDQDGSADDKRPVVLFNTSAIPAGATITSAELKFFVNTTRAFTVSAYPLNRAYAETQATWTVAATGTNWTAAGAEGDYGSSVGSFSTATTGYKSLTGASIISLVQGWVNTPSSNNGVLLKVTATADNGDARISSREGPAGEVPQILVTYELPTTDTTISATGTLVSGSGAQTVTAVMNVAMGGNSTAKTVTAPASLTPSGSGVGAITQTGGPVPSSQVIPAGGGTASFTYTYTVVPGASPGGVTFSGVASGGSASYVSATSNSVRVSPPLTFQVTVNGPPAQVGAVSNVAIFRDDNVIAPTYSPEALTALSGSIGDLVWADLDGDGVRDPGEPGLSGVQICATRGAITLCDYTDGNGAYRIFNLGAGTWTVTLDPATIPAGYTATTPAPLSVPLAANQQYNNADFGLRPPPGPLVASSIGDTLWIDADEDGVVDGSEPLLANITVRLYRDTNNNGVIDGADLLAATTSTDAAGVYSFGSLYAGDYLVDVDETDPQFPLGVELVSGGANGGGLHDVTLAAASNVTTADFGYNYSGSIGDYLWYDLNGDQIQNNAGDGGPVANAVVTLYEDADHDGELDAGEPIIGFTTTNGSGAYLFDNLPPGDYIVKVEEQEVFAPPSSPFAGQPARMQASTGTKKAVTLAPGQDFTAADFGFLEVAKVEGHVFFDANANGVLDPGETILPNVTVTLTGTDANGTPVSMTTTTNTDGEYTFLPPTGTYTVSYAVADPDIPAVLGTQTTPVSFLFAIQSGNEVGNLDFGRDNTGSIGDTIFANPNSNATQDSGEPGLANVVVNLYSDAARTILIDSRVTDSSGNYLFSGLADGTYYTRVDTGTLPGGYNSIPTADPDATRDSLGTAVVAGGSAVLTQDFGYTATVATFSVSGTIFKDLNTNSLPNVPGEQLTGVTVTAVVTTGAVTQTFTTTTDSNGLYTFAGIPTGSNVTVTVDPSTLGSPAYVQTVDPDAIVNNTTSISNITASVTGKNFGYVEQFGSIAGTVVRGDGDGLAEPGEAVQINVTVTLIYAGLDGIEGTGDDQTFTMPTNGTGDYVFTNLLPGNYSIRTTVPSGFAPLADADGTNPNSIAVTLAVGQSKVDQDFEYQVSSIGDYVWLDMDGDGIQESGEPPLAGVKVFIDLDGDGVRDANEPFATTDSSGLYSITGLAGGTYKVMVETSTLPAGLTPSYDPDGTGTPNYAGSVTLPVNTAVTTADFGYTGSGSISGTVKADTNNDNAGDTGLGGVTVTLFTDPNGDGDPSDGVAYGSPVVTDGNGNYSFTGLVPGSYVVVETTPSGYQNVTDVDATADIPAAPADATNASGTDDRIAVSLAAGEADTGNDFVDEQLGAISGFVLADTNNDNTGDTGIQSVNLTLYSDPNGDGDPSDGAAMGSPVTTAADGSYSFTNLAPGSYVVVQTQPAGYVSVTDGDGSADSAGSPADAANASTTDNLIPVTLAAGETDTQNSFVEEQPGSLGGVVWSDVNNNGQKDGSETGINGITVVLSCDINVDGDFADAGEASYATAITSAGGIYNFTSLPAGNYQVTIPNPPAGYPVSSTPTVTLDNQTAGDDNGSQAGGRGTAVTSPVIAISANENDQTIDFGMLASKATTFAAWQGLNPLGGQNGAGANPDGDRYSNFLEYALCTPPGSGVNQPFCLLQTSRLTANLIYTRLKGGSDITYSVETATALGTPTTWTILAGTPTIIDNGNGTETVIFSNVVPAGAPTDTGAFYRIAVTDTAANQTYYTEIQGWLRHDIVRGCETFSCPLLPKPEAAGVISGVAGQTLDLSASLGTADLSVLLAGGGSFYLEVTSGDNEGHRFDITGLTATSVTLANDNDLCAAAAPYNTKAGAAPPNLAGDTYAIYAHRTVNSMFPKSDYQEGNSVSTADRILVKRGSAWDIYWLYANGAAPSYWDLDGDGSFSDEGADVIPPHQGLFVHKVSADTEQHLCVGEVRTWNYCAPLCEADGYTLVAPGYPLDQSPDDLNILLSDGWDGDVDPTMADKFLIWNGDSGADVGYTCYWLADAGMAPWQYWTVDGDAMLPDKDTAKVFKRSRSAFLKPKLPRPGWCQPRPFTP